uniref:Large ribosomal subunit protein uL2 n=1 Tax=Hirondellea gigas TaxID=1518452 RepID=A0A6A7G967_9CRUS
MGIIIRAQRRGRGSIFKARTHRRVAPAAFRNLDFCERVYRIKGIVTKFCHDPGRGAPLAKIKFHDPVRNKMQAIHVVAVEGMYTGMPIFAGHKAKLTIGNILPLGMCPEGTIVCHVEETTGDKGIFAKSSGCYSIIVAHSNNKQKTRVRLPSGQRKTLPSSARCMIGIIAGGGRIDKPLMKAGNSFNKFRSKRKKWPRVRGVAMNPVEHPHGGGNHQHIGAPTTVSKNAPAGAKSGLVAARRSGLLRGGRKVPRGD